MQNNDSIQSSNIPDKPEQSKQKLKLHILKNIRGMGSFINTSTSFWKDSLDSTIMCCERPDFQIDEPPKSSQLFTVTNVIPDALKHSYTKEWTKEENNLLNYNYYVLHKKNFKVLSELLKTKSPQQCYYRIKKYEIKAKMKNLSRQDDLRIIELVDLYGKNWKKISSFFPGYTPEMIEERYKMKLDPKIKRTKFTEEEDEKILALYAKLGNKWKEIATFFPDRNINMVKNRFYTFLKYKLNNDIQKSELNDNSSSFSKYNYNNNYSNSNDNKTFSAETMSNFGIIDFNRKDDVGNNNNNNTNKNFFQCNSDSPIRNINLNENDNENYFNFPFGEYHNSHRNDEINDLFPQDNYNNFNSFNYYNNNNQYNDIYGNKKEQFFEMYQKVFPIQNLNNNDDVKMTTDIEMLSLLSNGNSLSSSHCEDESNLKKKNDETQKLFKQAYNLEELLHKIDAFQYEAPGDSKGVNEKKVELQLKELNEQKDKLTTRLTELKQGYANSLTNNKPDTAILLEINDTLLKLIAIGKTKIMLSKNIRDMQNMNMQNMEKGKENEQKEKNEHMQGE